MSESTELYKKMNDEIRAKKPKMAICYDFDKTLSPDDMQTFTLIPSFGIDKSGFWQSSNKLAKDNLMDTNLAWMHELIRYSEFKRKSLKREYFRKIGADVELYKGVKTWFKRMNEYNIASTHEGTRYSLFDLATWKNGFAFKQTHFSESGVPIIKIAELNNGIGSTTAYTQQVFSNEVHLKKGDLLFSWSGNPQTSIDIFRFSLEEGWLNQHIFKVTPKEELVTKDFFFFLMKYLKPHFTQIATNKQTTGLGHITIADIKRMSIRLQSTKTER